MSRKILIIFFICVISAVFLLNGCKSSNTHTSKNSNNLEEDMLKDMSEQEKEKLLEAIQSDNSQIVMEDSYKPEEMNVEVSEAQIIDFWVWFSINSVRFYNFDDISEKKQLLDEANNKLKEIHQNLTCMVGAVKNGKREITISANGIVTSFPYVKRLVDKAGTHDKFNIIAFKQRSEETEAKVGNLTLRYDDLVFKWKENIDKRRIAVDIYVKHHQIVSSELKTAVFNLLDNTIGEYEVETKIADMNIKILDENIVDTIPFSEFRAVVDNYYKNK